MSDLPPKGSTGWWQASTGKWYPPEEKPEPPKAAEQSPTSSSAAAPPPATSSGCGPGVWMIAGLAVLVVVGLLLTSSRNDSIDVRAVMNDVEATSSSIVTIRYTLTNESDQGGSVDCTARVENPVGSGFATLDGYLGPNETKSFTNEIVVTNNAAMETRSASIDCD